MQKPRRLRPSLSLLLVSFLSATAISQTSKVGGTLAGTIADTSAATIQGAQVHLRNLATNQTRTVTSDDQGAFRANELAVGTYEVRVEQPGFAAYLHAGVTLTVGETVRMDIQLVPATLQQQVTVTAQPPAIQATETSVTATVDRERIEESPVQSRNYLDFVLLAPGVASSNAQQTSSSQAPIAGSGFIFGGQRARSNNLSIDGVDNNDEFTGSSRTELSPEIVREFQVVNNGLSAEFGGASGGSINVVTKSGENIFHGDAFAFGQSGIFNARDPLESEIRRPSLGRYRMGTSVGGPLVKDRTFFYTAFEQEHARSESSSDIDPGTSSAINAFLATGAFPRLGTRQITTGFFPTARAETEASGKLDHQLNQQQSLMLRYAFTNNKEAGDAYNTSGLIDASTRGSSFTDDQGLVGSLVSLAGKSAVNDLRFQLATRRVTLRTNDQIGPEIDLNGLINFGRPYGGNSRRTENHYEVSDTFGATNGHHFIKAGVAVNRVSLDSSAPDGFGGVYIFRSLTDFFAGRADSFRQAFGSPSTDFAVTSYGGFAQDRWSVTQRMTLDLGLRYDIESLPPGINQDINNVSPRVGLAYSPSPAWVLRAGYGIFFDRYPLAYLNQAVDKNGTRAFEQVADGTGAADIFQASLGGTLQTPAAAIAPSIFRSDPRLATSYSQQTSFGVERLLTPNLTVSVNYLFVRGDKLARTRNVNLTPPTTLTVSNAPSLGLTNPYPQQSGREVFGSARADTRFNDIYQLENSASSAYQGLSLTLNRRLANDVELSASYTLAKTIDDASDFNDQPQNPFNLRADRGLSRNNQTQRFVFSGTFDLPFGEETEGAKSRSESGSGHAKLHAGMLGHIELAPIITVGSGRPVNPLTGLDSNQSHAFPLSARPLAFGRNTLQTPGFATVDLRVVKYIPFGGLRRLDFVIESFNLFNHLNVAQINPFFGTGGRPSEGFTQPVEAFTPRQIQLSLDFEF